MKDIPGEGAQTAPEERELSRRDLIKAAGGVAALMALGGGPLANAAFGSRRSSGSINLWTITSFTSQSNPPLMKAVAKYQAQTGVKVNVESFTSNSLQNTLITAVKGGGGPDVVTIDSGWVSTLAAANVLNDLTSEFKPISSSFFPGPVVSGQYLGKQWAVPWYTNNVGLYWNKDLFKAGGVAGPPTTWAELESAAVKLTNNGKYGLMFGGEGYGSFEWLPFAWQNGTNLFSKDGKQALFASPAGQAAWSFYAKLATQDKVAPPSASGATASWDQVNAPFIQEQVAMMMSGDWSLGPVVAGNPNLNFGVTPLPKGKFHATVAGGYDLALPTTGNSSAGWNFIKWLSDTKQEWILESYFRLPALKTALNGHFDPHRKAFLQQGQFAKPQPAVAQWSGILYGPLADAWESVLLGQSDPTSALNNAASKANQMLTA